MLDKFIPALICITVFVLLGVAVCRVGARADRRMAAENRELQPIGYESAYGAALEEFKARKAQFIADAMKAERERLVSVHVSCTPPKDGSTPRITLPPAKEMGL
jgi:hypothetical protein